MVYPGVARLLGSELVLPHGGSPSGRSFWWCQAPGYGQYPVVLRQILLFHLLVLGFRLRGGTETVARTVIVVVCGAFIVGVLLGLVRAAHSIRGSPCVGLPDDG